MKPIAPLAVIHLAMYMLYLPFVVVRRSLRPPRPEPANRAQRYRAVCVGLTLMGLVSWVVAWRLRIPLWGAPRQPWLACGAAAALVALFYYSLAPYRRYRIRQRKVRAMGPGELGWWALVSFCAGVSEELTYRGVASAILLYLGLPAWAVVLLVSAAFGLGHADRGPFHVVATFGMGALFHVLVLATGSLWPAMATHAVYDYLAGWSYDRMARKLEPSAAV